ncbi:heterogeneous nuclear ribonucleoprotein [Reticulomyxa filosa]|uniref:Heterogeneous nuclear ribonucleoprotein n=1 Tax=Reticulomyxa filosa TaxID=46433 RepID=X6MBB6_RETFI|nr:heterogeneous nuclear ribonucleoprotein [Reticulomyxa filosa]|eukprot:ETO10762.1 heterogeneous nuclear ribonucleoprotein [Reticulomyxa filosa]
MTENQKQISSMEEYQGKSLSQLKIANLSDSVVETKQNGNVDVPTTDKSKPRFVVRLRGLPWSAREKEISEFFKDEKIVEIHVVFLRNKKASGIKKKEKCVFFYCAKLRVFFFFALFIIKKCLGEAFVEFATQTDYENANLKNMKHLGQRYVEIFKATGEDIDTAVGRVNTSSTRPKSLHVLRMRGLPYEATENDVKAFFNNLNGSVQLSLFFFFKDNNIHT